MPHTEGNATENRGKRRRISQDGRQPSSGGSAALGGSAANAASGGAAASAKSDPFAALKHALGPRLEPLMGIFASQPTELYATLIPKIKGMLSLVATIRQREEGFKRFVSPWVDPATNQPHTDEMNQPRAFVPNSLRAKCPIKTSDNYNDDPDLQSVVREANLTWRKNQDEMAKHARKIASLEISLRRRALAHHVFDLTTTFAHGLVVTKQVTDGGANADMTLTRQELAAKTAFDALRDSPPNLIHALQFDNQNALSAAFAAHKNFDNNAIEEKMSEADDYFIQNLANDLHGWTPRMTICLWELEVKKERERTINAELRKALKPKAIAAANADVELAMDTMSAKTLSTVEDLARKEAAKEAARVIARINKSKRKNYSGGDETQIPRPTKNGQSGKKKSVAFAKGSKQPRSAASSRSHQNSPKPRRNQQKKTPDAPSQRRSSRKSASSDGNRDGAKGGGKRRGAGRR